MFELNGTRYSNEDLQNAATKYNMDFDSYLDTMKQKGLKEIDIEDTARQTAFEAAPNINVKLGLLFDSGVKIMKDLITDPEEQKETAEVLSNIPSETYRRTQNVFAYEIPNAIRQAYKKIRYDDLYDEEELKYLKTLDPNATYEEPSGDPTGFKTNADRIKYLEGYKSSSAGLAEQKANEKIVETIKKLEISDKYFRKDTGEGIVKGIKQGDASDLIGGIFNAGASTVETVVPAMLTYGTSIPFQITAPMITEYNQRKAENIYGKDDPDAIKKLFDNRQDELAVPATLGLIASSFEYVGFKGISNYILGKGVKNTIGKLALTGNKEGLTEIGQSGIEEVNIAKADGKDGLDLAKAFIDGVFSEKGIEAYLNGFIGGTTMSAGGSIVNRALRSDKASVKEFNNLVNDYAEFSFAKNKTTNKKDQKILGLQIKKIEQKIKDFVLNKRKIADILNEDQQSSLIDLMNQKDQNDSDIQNLQKRLQDNQITSKDAGYILRSLNNENKRIAEQVELINESAKEQLLQTSLETTKEKAGKLGLEQVELSREEFTKLFPDNADSDGSIQGNKIYINRDVARETGAIGVGSHELLHGIIGNSYNKLETEEKIKLNTEFLNLLSKKEKQVILNRLANSYNITGDKVFETEELFTAFSDEIVDGGLSFNEGVFGKIKNTIHKVLNKFGYKKEFESARQTYNFLKDYSKNIKEGRLTERAAELAKQDPGVEGQRQSRSKLIDDINNLQQGATTKAEFQKPEIFNKVFKSLQSGGAVNNYIRSLGMSTEKTQQTIDAVTDRLINFDPAAKRKDGTTIGPKGLGEFIMANVGFGKLVAAKKLAVEGEKTKTTTTIDTKEARELEAEDTVIDAKPRETKKIILADRLNVKNKVNDTIKKVLPKLDIKNLTFKKLKNELPQITGEMFGISPKKLISLANITKKELQAAQMFINKNADLLISMLPEGSTISGTATGVPNTILKAFYTKTDRAKMAKTGSTAGLAIQVKNKNISKKDFLETFGIIDGKPTRDDRNTSSRVLALANLTGKMMTNQAVRQNLELLGNNEQTIQNIKEGASSVMFSKSNKVFQKHNLPDLKINDPKDGFNNFDIFTDKMVLLATYGKPGLIRAVDLRGNITNSAVKDYVRSTTLYEELGLFTVDGKLNGVKVERVYLRPDAESALGKNIKNITKAKAKRYNEISKANFDDMIDMIQKAIKDNPKDKVLHSAIFEYLSSAVNDTSHPMRAGAEYIGGDITATGEIIYEHALQNANVRDVIIDALLDNKQDFNKTLKAIKKNYKLIALSKKDADAVDTTTYIDENGNSIKYKNGMGVGWDIFVDNWFDRYFNTDVNAVDPNNIVVIENGNTFAKEYNVTMSGRAKFSKNIKPNATLSKAMLFSRSTKNSTKGITVLDFDDTLATTESLVKYTAPNGKTGTLNAEEFASTYEDLQGQGFTFDFSDFNKVVKGKLAPLFQKALKLQNKFGPENMFVLTARPPASQKAIFDFLKANGLNIPLKNITGLGNSTSEAKALWIADKVGEGYNDFYFADDALQNVQAVKNMLDQFDVKSKVQQARVKFSQTLDKGFNDILQDVTGIKSEKRYSQAKARKRGEGKGKFRFFIPPSHEDFAGLLYNFMGSGRLGNKHRDFFEKALLKPLNRAYTELNGARQAIANDYKGLIRQFPEMRKKLTKKTPDGDYYYSDAVRVYLWNKAGFDIPGMSETDIKELTDLVTSDTELQAFAESIGIISKQEQGYVEPSEHWETGDIRTDLADATGRVGRKQFFGEFIENSDIIFSKENLNKIEAAYGRDFREALEDIIYRTKNGTNRTVGKNKTVNKFLDYLNGSIGATMFFNARSAVLQTISTVNFINFGDNNIFKAAKAFANQKQFWKDFSMIFNSDMLKQRRAGTAFDVNAAELSTAVAKSKEPVRAAIRHLLQIGFLPTQIADSFAISLGGSAMYRNRLNTYLKQGLSQKEAEIKAFNDFQEVAESTQQSARPDKISQEQASPLGRMILAFQNTPSQYVRLIKKAGLDLINRRKTPPYKNQVNSDMSNVSKIIYYGAVQNVIFYGLQTALFAMMFDDDEQDEEFFSKKRDRIISGSIDTILRGMGVGGAIVSTIKNTAIKWAEQQGKGWGKEDNALMMEMLQLSPPIGIKARKLSSAEKTYDYNKKVIKEMETFDIDNPIWGAVGNAVEATTNIPLARLHRKVTNLRQAANSENEWWQRLAMALGWSQWDVGVKNEEVEKVKESIKKQKSNRKSKGFKNFKFK